jgi:hypothetical protein
MTTMTETTTQVYQVFIKASPERIPRPPSTWPPGGATSSAG